MKKKGYTLNVSASKWSVSSSRYTTRNLFRRYNPSEKSEKLTFYTHKLYIKIKIKKGLYSIYNTGQVLGETREACPIPEVSSDGGYKQTRWDWDCTVLSQVHLDE